MIVVDTSASFALLDAREADHEAALEIVGTTGGPLVIPAATLGEVGYFLLTRAGSMTVAGFLDDIEGGRFQLDCGYEDVGRTAALVRRYADLPLGLVDAAVIACAERNRSPVLAFDDDFNVVAREGTITVLPES